MTCTHIPNHFYNNSVSLAACYVILYALVSMEVSLKAESSSRVLNDKFVWDRSYTCTAFKVLVKQFSVADKYFMVVYCLVNLWKPFLYFFMTNCIRYTVFEISHFCIIQCAYKYSTHTNYYMQCNLRQCDFTNGLTSKNPISSYFYIPLVFGKLVLCMKNNRFCFVYTEMDLGKNVKNITTWKRALEMLHSFYILHIFSML